MQVREKVVAIHCVFPMICGSGGSKSRLAKAAGAEPCGQISCTPLRPHFLVKMHKTHQRRTTFRSCDAEKVDGVVARSTFGSEKTKNTARSELFWKLRCRKSACRCGAQHISKSTCTKHLSLGAMPINIPAQRILKRPPNQCRRTFLHNDI